MKEMNEQEKDNMSKELNIGKTGQMEYEEKPVKATSGIPVLLLNLLLMALSIVLFVVSILFMVEAGDSPTGISIFLLVVSLLYSCLIGPIFFCGLKALGPNEAMVLTFFGNYYGTLRGPGYFFVNPLTTAVKPAQDSRVSSGNVGPEDSKVKFAANGLELEALGSRPKKISLKAMTLNNDKQKINDQLGNPIIIGIVVIWRVTNTAKAVFNVDNYKEFLSIQCDSALRNIVRLYPYDVAGDNNEKSLRGSSDEISRKLREEIQANVEIAGLEITEARITHLSYAQEIAAAMLQRQQASAIVDARQMIVDGAVGMVEMALARLNDSDIVQLDEERKAAMVSNLLVVLCGNKDAQPIVNSGSLY